MGVQIRMVRWVGPAGTGYSPVGIIVIVLIILLIVGTRRWSRMGLVHVVDTQCLRPV